MTDVTKVILKWEGGAKTGNAILFFPQYPANSWYIACYAHMGQHSEALMPYYWQCRNPITREQKKAAKELFAEYQKSFPEEVFKVVKRDTKKMQKLRWKTIN